MSIMVQEALLSPQFYGSAHCLHRQRSESTGALAFNVVQSPNPGGLVAGVGTTLRKQASQSLRGVPALPTTRCSCVQISANNNSKRSSSPGSSKMRRSILQFAKRLWNSEDSSRKVLCTNCKSDPVTLDTLCKKCCRRSTVCAPCYTRILSMHHTRLDRCGSKDGPYKCTECNLSPDNTSPRSPTPYFSPQPVSPPPISPRKPPPHFSSTDQLQSIPDVVTITTLYKSSSSSDSEYQSCSENIDPDASPRYQQSPTMPTSLYINKCVLLTKEDLPRTVAISTSATPLGALATRSKLTNPNRPAMIRSRAIEECDEPDNDMVKRSSMEVDSVVLKSTVIIPTFISTPVKPGTRTEKLRDEDSLNTPVAFRRSYSESSKDKRNFLNGVCRDRCGSVSDTRFLNSISSCHGNTTPVKRTVRIAEESNQQHSRPGSLEIEHVTVGEVTPTLYVKDTNNVIDSSFQQSESVLKRSLSVSNSRLQRKLSRKLGSKERQASDEVPFLRRNRSTSVDKSSPPPDLLLLSKSGIHIEDIQAFGSMYVQKLENRMRNIDALKELEKQHNISYRERLKTALDTHEQLAAGLEDVKKQLKECMEKYRFISETFV